MTELRCEHPDRFPGYCHCATDFLDALVAASRAPLKAEVARLRAALEEAIHEASCLRRGRWCMNHDAPMAGDTMCEIVRGWMDALTGAALAPEEGR